MFTANSMYIGISLLIGTCISRGVCFEFSMWLPYHGWRAHNWTSGDRGSEFYTNWWLSLTCRIICSEAYFTCSIAPCKGIRIPESGNFLLWNPESWALESGMQLNESGIPLKIGIQNPIFTFKDWKQESGIWKPWCEMQNPRLSWIAYIGQFSSYVI